ncbi:hypothetical protein [[Haemophilus] ducreyi]|uniref:hypothetical protein n=1 Tax=Haemophilus ducreyi TaxID=730 RepID=UPI0006565190|nr:hypothetical protein [[Haemophilus] ducreyi]AKO45631.1 hypothetical protein RZ66_05215 [[Haemophilus] ducreyi]AKO47017.1 hypothetical protein RZ67_05130 [[Haemophilus] ducreyi]AKO48362.1 hypothetical protein RZ68_05115 [[Haemophilus] ducreyi]AKO49749.1 hypothetical protein RZ69_05155 [[Haemophilus] ducreyi]ANF61357.1 hypothetical protein A6037_00495 [[Haemophilus] ducreyi]
MVSRGADALANTKFAQPELKEFDLKFAFSQLKLKLEDFVPTLSMPAGHRPKFTIPVFNKHIHVNVHCRIFQQHGDKLSAVFLFIWGFLAIRILLSA